MNIHFLVLNLLQHNLFFSVNCFILSHWLTQFQATFIYELNFRVLSKAGQIDRLHSYEHEFVGLVSQSWEIISFEEVHFKMFCPPVRTNYLPADNGDL